MGVRPDVIDWGIVGETVALRKINTQDPIDMERYWETNQSTPPGLMVNEIYTREELAENAKLDGRREGFTFAISGILGEERGEFQGFVQFTPDSGNELRTKITTTGLFVFSNDVALWEISYAKYPPAPPHQVASAVRQGSVLLLRKLKTPGFYPRVAIIGCVGVEENPASVQVLKSACFEPIGSVTEKPAGIIVYDSAAQGLDSVWLLNWNSLNQKLRKITPPYFERCAENLVRAKVDANRTLNPLH
jgi:hypothetical protein